MPEANRELSTVKVDLGKTIRFFRTNAGIKQKDFAKKLGITASYLSLVETGRKRPSIKLIEKIAEKLNIPINYLFWYGKEPRNLPRDQEKLFNLLNELLITLQRLQSEQTVESEE